MLLIRSSFRLVVAALFLLLGTSGLECNRFSYPAVEDGTQATATGPTEVCEDVEDVECTDKSPCKCAHYSITVINGKSGSRRA